jgi:hypothetical protein
MELRITSTNKVNSYGSVLRSMFASNLLMLETLEKVQGDLKITQSELRVRDEQIARLQKELQSKSEKSQKDQEQKRGFEQLARQNGKSSYKGRDIPF